MRRWIALCFAALLMVPSGTLVHDTRAIAAGCTDFRPYKEEMVAAANALYQTAVREGLAGREPATYSTDEWNTFSDAFQQLQLDLKDITPPEWAEDWHVNRIAYAGLIQQTSRAIATQGIFGAAVYSDQIDDNAADELAAVKQIEAGCSEFRKWATDWDAINGFQNDLGDASSEATAVPISVTGETINLAGNGHTITDRFELEGGRYLITTSCSAGYFYAEFLGQDTSEYYPTVYEEESVEQLEPGFYRLEVECNEDWTIRIEPFTV